MTSIRRRLLVRLIAVGGALLAVAAASLYAYTRSALLAQFDQTLAARAASLATLLRVESDGTFALDLDGAVMPEYSGHAADEYFTVFDPAGRIALESDLVKHDGRLIDTPPQGSHAAHAWNLKLPDGRDGRGIVRSCVPTYEDGGKPAGPELTVRIAVARSRAEVDRVLNRLVVALIIGSTALAIAGIAAAGWIVSTSLRPLDSLAAQADAIGPNTLGQRFAADALGSELVPISRRFNDLLDRLDRAFQRERRISGDIAHELRTPIAELRTLSEVALRFRDSGRELADPGVGFIPTNSPERGGDEPYPTLLGDDRDREYLQDAHSIALRMESLISTLIALARAQSTEATAAIVRVDAADSLRAAVERATQRGGTVGLSVAENLFVDTSPPLLDSMLDNLLANAIDHVRPAPPTGRVECRGEGVDGVVTLTIGNDDDTLCREDLPRLFDPFWRKDAARSNGHHAGLGLALVAEYARHLGVELIADLPRAGWFEIRLKFPASRSNAATPTLAATHSLSA